MQLYSGDRSERVDTVFSELKDYRVAIACKAICKIGNVNPGEKIPGYTRALDGLEWHVGLQDGERFVYRWMFEVNKAISFLYELDSIRAMPETQPMAAGGAYGIPRVVLSPAAVSGAIDSLRQELWEAVEESKVARSVALKQTEAGARLFEMTAATVASLRASVAAGQIELLLNLSGQKEFPLKGQEVAVATYQRCLGREIPPLGGADRHEA